MKLMKVITGALAVLPFLVTSCTEDIPDFNKQLQADIAAIDDYLTVNNIVAIEDPSGLRYVIHQDSTDGKAITVDSCVTATYSGRLLSTGVEFDNGEYISFPLNRVIDGWKLGIPLLKEGESATFYIPSGLGYGDYGHPPDIPANANLIFDVTINKVGTTYKTSDGSCN